MAETSFQQIYDHFLGKITEDMYMVWDKEDTEADLYNILMDAIPGFEFPRFRIFDYDLENEKFNSELTGEEINILALLMYNTWLQRQIASVDNIRQKFTGSDFKMTSQASHLDKLMKLKQEAERQAHHMQRLYGRRMKDKEGLIKPSWSSIMEKSAL